MASVKTLLTLCRVSNLPTVWMNAITAAVIVSLAASLNIWSMVVIVLALSCFYTGGMSLNDYFDRHWDAERQPYRPIPSGRIGASAVMSLSLGLFAAGLLLLVLAPDTRAPLAGLLLLAVIVLYDWLHKRHWASVFLMSMARWGVYLVTAVALVGEMHMLVWLAGCVQTVYTLLLTVVARWENSRPRDLPFPLIPWMIAGMGLIDGLFLALLVHPAWLLVGVLITGLTRLAQRYVRGD